MESNDFNYIDDVEALLSKKREQLLNNKTYSNKAELFRTNYIAFNKIVLFYKMNPRFVRELGESAAGEIKKILLANNHINSLDDISDAQVNNYMSKAREHFSQEKKAKKSKQNRENVIGRYENFNLSSTAGAVAMVDEVTQPGHEKDWLDPEWIGAEPDWNAIRAKTLEPVPGEWSDSWENVWRHLYMRADEHGLNEEMKKSYAGFKSMGDDIGGLWLALNKTRRQLKAQHGWNPVGVGKAV